MLRPLRRTLAPAGAALVFVMLALAAPQAAFAHAYLVRSTPEGGERLARPPATLLLYFSEPFVEGSERVSLRRVDGEPIGAPAPIRRGTVVRQSLPPGLHGVIVAHWNVLSEDGHPSLGEFGFAVGDAGELPELSASASQSTPWGQSAAVWLFFLGLALALGGLVSASPGMGTRTWPGPPWLSASLSQPPAHCCTWSCSRPTAPARSPTSGARPISRSRSTRAPDG